MKKQFLKIFILSFLLNLVWENAHSFLYLSYKGGAVTEIILLRAALVDAALILLVFAVSYLTSEHLRLYYFIIILLVIAILIEMWALFTHRWLYNRYMPIIPFLKIGLSPVIQLAVTGYISGYFAKRG